MAMQIDRNTYRELSASLQDKKIKLVAVSKTKPADAILELYHLGQRDFGENYVQELIEKEAALPKDVRWHFIGHLQTNKVKYLAPFVSLIHGVDSFKLLKEIDKQGLKNNRVIPVLLQVHIAREETKFGFDKEELTALFQEQAIGLSELKNVRIEGLMGMASFSSDPEVVRSEFRYLKQLFDQLSGQQRENLSMSILSMGMSGDYRIAIEEGSTLVRIGSLLFGAR
jgi:pyridoxal phosphate enzyme (YggS family)